MKIFLYCLVCMILVSSCFFVSNKETSSNNNILDEENSITNGNLIENSFNRLIVRAAINNTECNVAIDTGGNDLGSIIMDSAFFYTHVDTCELVNSIDYNNRDHRLLYAGYYTGKISLCIGGDTIYAEKIIIFKNKFSHFKYKDSSNFVAIIGKLYFDKVMSVNFDENKLVLADSLFFDTSDYTPIEMYPPRKIETIENDNHDNKNEKHIEIGGFIDSKGNEIKGRFLFDTGSYKSLILETEFGKKLKIPKNYDIYKDPREEEEAMWIWYANSLNFGDLKIDSVHIEQTLLQITPGHSWFMDSHSDGILGMDLIKRFNFIADFKNNVIYLKPNKFYYNVNTNTLNDLYLKRLNKL